MTMHLDRRSFSRLLFFVTIVTVTLAATACGNDDAQSDPADDGDPVGTTTWVLVEGEADGDPLVLLDSHPVTLERSDDGIRGTAACNSYGADASIGGSSISIGGIFQTEMACDPPEAMAVESSYLAALGRVDTIVVDREGLTLTGNGVRLAFFAQAAERDAALVDTAWTLDTIIDGQTASTPLAGTEANLTIDEDGAVTGSTGCNTFMGEIAFDDTTWEAAPLASTRMACAPELMTQEAAVLRILSEGPDWIIEGPTLTLTLGDGTGLQYRAG